MKIAIIEDDRLKIALIKECIEEEFDEFKVDFIETESSFFRKLEALSSDPPFLFVVDMMLPWCNKQDEALASEMTRCEDHHENRAGIRCYSAIRSREIFKQTPVIFFTAIDLRGFDITLDPNAYVLYKDEVRVHRLLEVIQGLVRVSGAELKKKVESKIFIVHGHDEEAKESVARLVQRVGGDVIVLREQPNAGRTIIEKFEEYSEVSFVVVLLTPDDIGGKLSGDMKPRSRQNVIFELGFFFAKLGRAKVAVLSKGDIELPSDIESLICIRMDKDGGWQMSLLREMRAAGLTLDFANAF